MQTNAINLRPTYQPGCFYVEFSELPAAARDALQSAEVEVECSAYTVWTHVAFLRAEVELNGERFDAEISFGDLSPEDWRPEGAEDDDSNDDAYAEAIAAELVACSELEYTTVYLTRID